MNSSQKLLSDLTTYLKYAKYDYILKRREDYDEIVTRYIDHLTKKYPDLKEEIIAYSGYIYDKRVLPSMRFLQFAGPAIARNQSRVYNCFSRNTSFITANGVKSFKDFVHGDNTTVLTHTGEFKKAVVKSYGKQSLNEVVFKKGRSTKKVNVTSNHRWILKDGTHTTDLRVGDVLYESPDFISDFDWDNVSIEEKIAWCYGFVYGDGTLVKNGNGEYTHSMVRLCGNDIKYLYRFEQLGFKSSSSMSLKGDVIVYTGKYLKTLPDITSENFKELKGFIIGYLDADGFKNYDPSNRRKYNGIQASGEESIDFIEKAFEVCSMYILSSDDLTSEETNYSIRPYTKRFKMNHVISKYANAMWSVSEIKRDVSLEEVWCLEVEDDHSFVLSGGLVTGNCGFMPMDNYLGFSELMFLLLGGTGIGYSVQLEDIKKLPVITHPKKERKFLIGDSIEGWADAVKHLMKAYFGLSTTKPRFDYSDIREKGARLITAGGKAPGPEPLRIALTKIESLLRQVPEGTQLRSIDVHDICCHIADAVLAGGIRRAALISLFSINDVDMMLCKHGQWWVNNPQRGRANNSVVLDRKTTTKEQFYAIWKIIEASKSGEPGIYFTNDLSYGTNPCGEISLRPFTFCNLTEINGTEINNIVDLVDTARAAAFFGTLQAGFTDFHYLREIWKTNTEKDSLIGVGITGIASSEYLLNIDNDLLAETVNKIVVKTNEETAKKININPAARTTTIKPSGTTSCVLGTSSGIHSWYEEYYIRNIQCRVKDDLYVFFTENHKDLIKIMDYDPYSAVIGIPQKAPENAVIREKETVLDQLERISKYNKHWVHPGSLSGPNTNNVSATVYVKDHEWEELISWMWDNRDTYNGLSVLPYDNGTYKDAPFQKCTKEEYNLKMQYIENHPINLKLIEEIEDNTNTSQESACFAGNCEINY